MTDILETPVEHKPLSSEPSVNTPLHFEVEGRMAVARTAPDELDTIQALLAQS